MTRTATVRYVDPTRGPTYEEIDLDLQDELHRLRERARITANELASVSQHLDYLAYDADLSAESRCSLGAAKTSVRYLRRVNAAKIA